MVPLRDLLSAFQLQNLYGFKVCEPKNSTPKDLSQILNKGGKRKRKIHTHTTITTGNPYLEDLCHVIIKNNWK